MNADRTLLNDQQWSRIASLLPGKQGNPGRAGANNRRFFEALPFMARTGLQWRDMEPKYGNWNSVYQRFRRWSLKGVFEKVFNPLSDDPDFEYAMIDGTIVRVHQDGTGAKGGPKIRLLDDPAVA